jgi:hypothetical protein
MEVEVVGSATRCYKMLHSAAAHHLWLVKMWLELAQDRSSPPFQTYDFE